MLGYTVDNAGNPIIDEEQAEIVREIFRLYLTGLSERAIASALIKMGIKTSTGKLSWSQKNIRIILENEKYKGDSRLQKTIYHELSYQEIQKEQWRSSAVLC